MVFVLKFSIIHICIQYYSNNLNICIRIRTKVALRVVFVFVFGQISEPEYIRICIRPNLWNRIVFVFGPKNTIRSPLSCIWGFVQLLFLAKILKFRPLYWLIKTLKKSEGIWMIDFSEFNQNFQIYVKEWWTRFTNKLIKDFILHSIWDYSCRNLENSVYSSGGIHWQCMVLVGHGKWRVG